MLGRRGYPLEVAAAQVCREGGARVFTNVYVRDMDLAAFNALDSSRLEVVADGLTLFGGAQPAMDTAAAHVMARHWKSHGAGRSAHSRNWQVTKGRARLVVLAAEVGGWWNAETASLSPLLLSVVGSRPVPRISEVPSSHEVLRDDRLRGMVHVSSWSFFVFRCS